MKKLAVTLVLFSAFSIFYCKNPAADKPKAETGPAAIKQEESSSSKAEDSKNVSISLSEANLSVGFVGSKVTGSHEGKFEKVSGTVKSPELSPTKASVKISIDMSSVKSDSEKLDEHLKSPDFFDSAKFPEALFESTAITASSDTPESFNISGNLTLHGVTKLITFPAKISVIENRIKMQTEFSINRKDFDIVYPGMPDDLIRDEVLIKLSFDSVF